MQSSHNGQEPQVWTFKPDDPNPHEEEDQQRMLNQDDELRNEVEEMFNKLPDRSVECCVADGIDPFNPRSGLMQLQHEVSWTFDGKSNQPREDWREQERVDRDNTKRSVANAKGGRK